MRFRSVVFCCVSCLVRVLVQLRSAAFIYLKNLTKAEDDNLIFRASDATLETIKSSLLHAFEHENDDKLRMRLLYTSCAFAGTLVPLRKWDAFFPTLFGYARSNNTRLREFSMRIVAVLTRDLTGFMRDNISTMLELLSGALNDQQPSVRAAALDVYSAFLVLIEDNNVRQTLAQMLPVVLGGIMAALHEGAEESAQIGIDALTSVAENDPLFLKRHATDFINGMLDIAQSAQLQITTRRLAVEFIVSLYESRASLVRRTPNVLQRLMPVERVCVAVR